MYDDAYKKKFGTLPVCTERYLFDFENDDLPDFIRERESRGQSGRPMVKHNHELPEFIYVIDGELDVSIGQTVVRLREGELLSINPYEIHSAVFVGGCKRLEYRYMILSPTIFSGCQTAAETFEEMRKNSKKLKQVISGEVALRLGSLMEESAELLSAKKRDDLLISARIFEFMSIIFNEGIDDCQSTEKRSGDFIREIGKYIEANYSRQLTTASMSAEFGYNRNYFCSLFKENFGMSFSSYLCEHRIRRAAENFKGTNWSLSEIAEYVGFSDYCYFSRCFSKVMGLSPSKYFRGVPPRAESNIVR